MLAALWNAPCYAADWAQVIKAVDGTVAYVDLSSIVKTGDVQKFWAKLDFSRVKTDTDRDQVSLYYVHCKNMEVKHASMVSHLPSGAVSRSWTVPAYGSAPWEAIAPDTLMDAMARYVCSE